MFLPQSPAGFLRALSWVAVGSVLIFGCQESGSSDADARIIDTGDTGGMGGMGGNEGPDMAVPDQGVAKPACSDEIDNDGDGEIDLDDPGCDDAEDTDERNAAACANGEDDDQDGFVDFPADPGCGSEFDDDEFNEPVSPQCNDGVDNDRDGLVDEQDPGCASVADPSEGDPMEPPQCFDGVDNDLDGIIDFPAEPGCSAAGDDDETDPERAAACANGQDDDADDLIDYPVDPGCAGVGDRDETDKSVTPACADGVDNDRDGKTDYPDDDGCESAADYTEKGSCGDTYDPPTLGNGQSLLVDSARGVFESQGSCGGNGSPEVAFLYRLERDVEALEISTANAGTQVVTTLYVRRSACLDPDSEVACQREDANAETPGHTLRMENPAAGDYYIFVDGVAGVGGPVELTVTEIEQAHCLNGIDDDEDELIDYPVDPGCDLPDDRDETDPPEYAACFNGEDDDGDGQIDFPADPGCISAAANDEVDRCGQGVRFREYFFGREHVLGDTREAQGGVRRTGGSCGGNTGPEIIYHYYNPVQSTLTISTAHPETMFQSVLYVRTDCGSTLSELECDDGQAAGAENGRVVIEDAAVGDYWIYVDTRFGLGGPFKLTVGVEELAPGCGDGRDNDEDGLVDGEDPGCEDLEDQDERDPPAGTPPAACANLEDDDEDGETDYPFDPGCVSRGDQDEADPEEPPACSNGLDDDEDGRVDFPIDGGCQSRGDTEERDPLPRPQCANNIDDDQDGMIDYPIDPGCAAAGDASELNVGDPPVCANGVDDDRDGIADFPFDRGCSASADPDETDEEEDPVCSNGVDDDEDMLVDFPLDPGCRYAADPSEDGPNFPPACANMRDDDMDGRTDFPDDPGCRFAADGNETNEGVLPVRCADGVDNDLDGAIDLQDLGCLDNEDDDEEDGEVVPLCGNEVDDDEDMLIDWPDDPGCQARGDLTEDQSCRPEVEVVDLMANAEVMGATLEEGADVYYSRCGGRMAPDAVYRYELLEPADRLVISAANEGTDFPAVLSVRTDCEEPDSLVACAGNFAAPDPEVTIRDAEAGEYYIFIDGGGPEQWVSTGGNGAVFNQNRVFAANQADLRNDCGWSDGGNDAFDCYGQISVAFGGAPVQINTIRGNHDHSAGAYSFTADSDFAGPNIWRVDLRPAVDFDDRRVSFSLTGNLGSDGGTQSRNLSTMFEGREVRYVQTADGPFDMPRFDPPVIHAFIPGDPDQLGNVMYAVNGDAVTITAADITLPATLYVAIGYAPQEDMIAAILGDLEIQAGPGGDEAPRFGNFQLNVTEERDE